eukprot:TRINITY_DN48540_c0_g1_i1.p1 TRINITY_DN48540_c0_g1~~TRINITY_DN48540_c0_g1_i1.p1  ORF type:complete len:882 (-),score=144.54 TRINITY_DN48540_c0_g1_i1:132-2777(-)
MATADAGEAAAPAGDAAASGTETALAASTDGKASVVAKSESVTALVAPPPAPEERLSVRTTSFPISRLQMLEYINVRTWWTKGQTALLFTLAMWSIFVYIVWIRMDVVASQEVNGAILGDLRGIAAHPSLGGTEPKGPDERPVQCRCACQGAKRGLPLGPCGGRGSAGLYTEVINFEGRLPMADALSLSVPAGGSKEARVVRWADIMTLEDAWYWLEFGLLAHLWTPSDMRDKQVIPGLLLGRNMLVGGLRVRQTRAKTAAACNVDAGLQPHYPVDCRDPLLPAPEPAPDASLDTTTALGLDLTLANKYATDSYGTSLPGVFDAKLDIGAPMNEAQELMAELRKRSWCDTATRNVQVSAVFFNAEVGVYSLLQVTFELPPGGGLIKHLRSRALHAIELSEMGLMDFWPEIIWGILIGLLVFQELKQLLQAIWNKQLKEYLSDPWNYLDWVSVAFGVPVALFWFGIASQTGTLSQDVLSLPTTRGANVAAHRMAYGKIIDDSEAILITKYNHALFMFAYATIITGRFMKNAMTQQKLATLQMAIASSFVDVVHFLAIYVTLFANFVIGGRILFGPELEEWSSFSSAASTAVRILMGKFEFERLVEIAPFMASVWFWFFLLSQIFILSNLLISIITEHWATFRKLVGKTPSILKDAQLGWKDLLWRLEWRYESCKDGEYWESLGNPYAGLVDELLEKAEADERLEQAQRKSSLGCRLVRRHMESMSLEGLSDDGSAGGQATSGLEIRRMGADPMTAQHLLEECEQFLAGERSKETSALDQVRQLGKLIRLHKKKLDEHCRNIEDGMEEDREHLWQGLKRLERSVRVSLENFSSLRETGVDTLAPPLPSEQKNFQLEDRKVAIFNGTLRSTAATEDMQLQIFDG